MAEKNYRKLPKTTKPVGVLLWHCKIHNQMTNHALKCLKCESELLAEIRVAITETKKAINL